jgi:hypothetical protein
MSNATLTNFSFVEKQSIVTREQGVSEKTGRPLARLEYSVSNGLLMGKGTLAPATALKKYLKANGGEEQAKGKAFEGVKVQQQQTFNRFTDRMMNKAKEDLAQGKMQAHTCLAQMEGDTVTGYVFKVKVAGKALKRAKFAEALTTAGIEGQRFDDLMAAYDKGQA